jgi:lipopolysaccharide transport system permease protein
MPSRSLASDFLYELRRAFSQYRLALLLMRADRIEMRRQQQIAFFYPFISLFLQVVILSSVYSNVFGQNLTDYLPYFAVSLATWQAITIFASKASAYNDTAHGIASFQDVSPLVVQVAGAAENMLLLSLKIVAAVIAILLISPHALAHLNLLALLPSLLLVYFCLFFAGIHISYLLDRFRLLRAMLPQILFIAFLITPILWRSDILTAHRWIVEANPLFHLIEIVREPILAGYAPVNSLLVIACATCLLCATAPISFRLNRELIIFRWIA